jgi:predicted metal-binding protein
MSYDDHVKRALNEVKYGQHLRFINELYRTKEVCLAALLHETSHNSRPYDIGWVPVPHLDYVFEKLKETNNETMLEYITNYVDKRKKTADMSWLPEKLKKYKVSTYDELLKEIYLEKTNKIL